jgi:hypothetical protein
MDAASQTPAVTRRDILQILAALGFTGAAADRLAAASAPTVSPEMLRGAASMLAGGFDDDRLRVAQAAVQRNLEQLQVVRELELPDAVEPAVQFRVRRS